MKKLNSAIRLAISCLVGLLIGCATSALQDFSRVKKGMDKTDVLDLAGSPLRKAGMADSEIWKYRIYDNGREVQKEIYFRDGHVTYVGDPLPREELIVKESTSQGTDERSLDSSTEKSGEQKSNSGLSKTALESLPGQPSEKPAGSNFKEVE